MNSLEAQTFLIGNIWVNFAWEVFHLTALCITMRLVSRWSPCLWLDESPSTLQFMSQKTSLHVKVKLLVLLPMSGIWVPPPLSVNHKFGLIDSAPCMWQGCLQFTCHTQTQRNASLTKCKTPKSDLLFRSITIYFPYLLLLQGAQESRLSVEVVWLITDLSVNKITTTPYTPWFHFRSDILYSRLPCAL